MIYFKASTNFSQMIRILLATFTEVFFTANAKSFVFSTVFSCITCNNKSSIICLGIVNFQRFKFKTIWATAFNIIRVVITNLILNYFLLSYFLFLILLAISFWLLTKNTHMVRWFFALFTEVSLATITTNSKLFHLISRVSWIVFMLLRFGSYY